MKQMLLPYLLSVAVPLFSVEPISQDQFSDPRTSEQATSLVDEKVWEIVTTFPMEDQERILRLMNDVDLSSFKDAFASMRPYACARFLRISAYHCFPFSGEPSRYKAIVNLMPELSDFFDSLLLQKIAEQELVRRHVIFDQVREVMIWDPRIFAKTSFQK